MTKPKHYTNEKLTEYVASEVELIKKEREDPKNWHKNEMYDSLVQVRTISEEE